jgi:HPt (histidine-containing phosphotransfer) domain-containing protein
MDQDARRPIANEDGTAKLPTFDETVLIDLLDGDAQLAAEVLRDFEGALKHGADEIDAAFRENRVEDLVVASHKLKSSSRTVGAMALGQLCERLEAGAKSAATHSVQRMILAVMAEIGAVGRRLRATGK